MGAFNVFEIGPFFDSIEQCFSVDCDYRSYDFLSLIFEVLFTMKKYIIRVWVMKAILAFQPVRTMLTENTYLLHYENIR